MGLDISAYTKLRKAEGVDKKTFDYDKHWQTHVVFSDGLIDGTEKEFPGRTAGLDRDSVFHIDPQNKLGFRAGSYSGYNSWRQWLAKMVGIDDLHHWWENPQPGPFAELLNFSDCEGVIGPEVSKKLAKDFEENREKALELAGRMDNTYGTYWLELYDKWALAFKMAADGGAVDFH